MKPVSVVKHLSANLTKWSNTLGNSLTVFDHFAGLALKGLSLYQ